MSLPLSSLLKTGLVCGMSRKLLVRAAAPSKSFMKGLIAKKSESQSVKITSVYDALAEATKPIVVCVGGASSSKSHSLAQLMIWKLVNERDKVIGIGRKTFPSLRMTAYQLVVNLLKEYGIYPFCDHSKTENTIAYGSNRIQFFSLDDPEKIKSFNANVIWLEEANEFGWDDFLIIKLRLNRNPSKGKNQIYLSLNPVDVNCWVYDKLKDSPETEIIKSTYKDNPFNSPAYIQQLEDLQNQDMNYYRIYALGEWGRLENIIYPRWQLIDEMPAEFQEERYGLDFGFENPSACIHIGIISDRLYVDEVLYQTHLTNTDLIERLKLLMRLDLYADSAEPQRIEEICRAGFRCYPAIKDVSLGIDTVKRYAILITKRSANLIKEIRGYQRKKDRDGRVLEEPVKFNDHGVDALRYGVIGGKRPAKFGFSFI